MLTPPCEIRTRTLAQSYAGLGFQDQEAEAEGQACGHPPAKSRARPQPHCPAPPPTSQTRHEVAERPRESTPQDSGQALKSRQTQTAQVSRSGVFCVVSSGKRIFVSFCLSVRGP